MVAHRKTPTYQPIGNEGSYLSSVVPQNDLQEQSHSYCLRQHLHGVIHKQTGWHKIHRTLCSNVENFGLVQLQKCHIQSKTCNLVTQSDSGIRSTDIQTSFQDMGESPSGPICDQP